jgi:hypothetical protein
MQRDEFITKLEDLLFILEEDEEHDYDEQEVSDLLMEAGLHTL